MLITTDEATIRMMSDLTPSIWSRASPRGRGCTHRCLGHARVDVIECPVADHAQRTEENVATASTSVPPAVANEAIVGQSAIRREGQRL
jgi:hypothetical protein